ncbi:protein kinase domain-containing protein [Photobacterium minamisatsumaniensis]|uniref:protein kinase domain-containing protein n=1 Tax=Photobacterium minamisatsumaniensis TaxID=2910233 RepID=UPI003D1325CC
MSVTESKLAATVPVLQVQMGGKSVAGVRATNQDAFAVSIPKRQAELKHKGVVACIADGVSCSDYGQQASHTAVTQFIDDYYAAPTTWGVRHTVAKVLNALNLWLFAHGDQHQLTHNGLITTFSAVVIKSNTAHIAHVGDSRIYHYRAGRFVQVTQDHCRRHIGTRRFLTRALGMDNHLEVDFQQLKLEQGDWLLMTTDGVHDWLSDTQLVAAISGGKNRVDPERLAEDVIEQALVAGSTDNVSCLLLRIDDLPTMSLQETITDLTKRAIPPVMEVGNRIDQYEIIRVLHSGTRSHVYLASSLFDGKSYVLKTPSINCEDDYQYLQAFVREGWIGEQIQHSSVMKIHPHSRSSSFLYHVCEYIEGRTLRQWMYDNPTPELDKVRVIVSEIIKSLRVLQRNGIVHRDLKPENIIINGKNKITIIDFGAAQVDGLNEIGSPIKEELPVGDLKYISPECLATRKATFKADMFSLVVITYEMLTGKYPYNVFPVAEPKKGINKKITYTSLKVYRDDLPPWLDLVVQKGCHPEDTHRYQAFTELEFELSTPCESLLLDGANLPLIKKDPVLFWKVICVILTVIIAIQLYL